MFGWIEDTVTELVTDTLDMATAVITLGDQGEFSTEQIGRMVANGASLAATATTTGIALEVLEE